ncbi:DNA mismatch repair protein MutS [Lentinula edodes]|nr:DNA mismatch repair protein MutS [Lentinula edodes]
MGGEWLSAVSSFLSSFFPLFSYITWDDIARGRSTFMVEMSETREILHSAAKKSFVILDELGRGTSTFDGMSIAHAVLHHLLTATRCKTLFITHYPLVAVEIQRQCPGEGENLHMGYTTEEQIDWTRDVVFMYRVKKGIAQDSFGVECGDGGFTGGFVACCV